MNDSNDQKPLEDHEYDGIYELNNPAPFWWQLSFYISIAVAIGYYGFYELGPGKTSDQRLQENLAEVQRAQSANQSSGPNEKELLAILADAHAVHEGKETFASKCSACHGPDGGGLIGPNLTDHFWINGKGTITDIYKVVNKGVPDKGMPAWGALMKNEELSRVVAYVKSLSGTKPANPKAPQGTEIK